MLSIANKYKLALCEPFHPAIHGQDNESTPAIETHFLVYTLIELPDFYNNAYKTEEKRYRKKMTRKCDGLLHPTIRQYAQVANKYMRLEIIETDELQPGQEAVAYLKLFWLKIVQRCWKKVYQQRQAVLKERMTMAALRYRERTGRWQKAWPLFRLNL
jgi:hypothetical protein